MGFDGDFWLKSDAILRVHTERQQVLEQTNVNKALFGTVLQHFTRRTGGENVTTQQFAIGEISENSKFRNESSFVEQ